MIWSCLSTAPMKFGYGERVGMCIPNPAGTVVRCCDGSWCWEVGSLSGTEPSRDEAIRAAEVHLNFLPETKKRAHA